MPYAPVVSDQSSNYFARFGQSAGTNSVSIKTSPQDKAAEVARKEADKQQAEEAKRLRTILVGHGVPKGQAEGMSVGELKGTLDTWTMKHARSLEAEKQKRMEEQQQFENDQALQRLGLSADEMELRRRQMEAQTAEREAKARTEAEAMSREQRARQAGMAEASLWEGGEALDPGGAGPSQSAAATRGYLGAGGMEPQMMRAMGDVFAPAKSDQISWGQDPLGNPIGIFNGQVVQPRAEREEAANVYPTSKAAMDAAKADGFPESRVGVKPKGNGFTYTVSTGSTDRLTAAVDALKGLKGAPSTPAATAFPPAVPVPVSPAKRSVLDDILSPAPKK